MYKGLDSGKRTLSLCSRCKILYFGQTQRQLFIRHAHNSALVTVNHRNGLAPITLPVESPVFHLILDASPAFAHLFQFGNGFFYRILLIRQPIQESGIDHLALAGVCLLGDISPFDHLDDIDSKLLCKVVVSLVVCRHSHNCAGPISHHYIVGNIDRDFLSIYGIYSGKPPDAHPGFILVQLGAFKLRFLCTQLPIRFDLLHIGDLVSVCIDDRVFRCHDHKGDTKKRIRPRRVHRQLLLCAGNGKIHKSTGGLANPVDLLLLDTGQIIHFLQPLQQFVGVLGDPQIPHVLGFLHHFAVTNIAPAPLGILVGQHHLTAGAVIHQGLVAKYQSVIQHFPKDPLGPLIIVHICSIDHSAPVQRKAYPP